MNRHRSRVRLVLRDRFGLVLRPETRQLPVCGLVPAKGGHKLKAPDETKKGPSMSTNAERGQMTGFGINMHMLTNTLSGYLQRPVIDETSFTGTFDMALEWKPDAIASVQKEDANPEGASIFTAIQEQLGLRLESRKGPVTVYVVEKVEKPGDN